MRPFNWKRLLDEQRIPYIERGPNVKRGELNISCPFCGSADPSKHMGLNLDTGWWACWRNRTAHSGKSPLRLLVKLLDVPYWRAAEIAGVSKDYIDPEGFDALAARLMRKDAFVERPEQVQRRFLAFDRYFLPVTSRPSTRMFWNYLYGRGFEDEDVDPLVERYCLKCARDGDFAHRLIIPYFQDGRLITWTGRAVGHSPIRYKDLSRDQSIVPPKEALLGYDGASQGGRLLAIVEGPVDYLKLDYYASSEGIRAVALSTNSISEEQCYLLEEVADRFDYVAVILDTLDRLDVVMSMQVSQQLYFCRNLKFLPVPNRRKDFGETPAKEIKRWASSITRELS